MAADEQAQEATPTARRNTPWPARFRAWWNLPRAIGLTAAVVGLVHYTPWPALPVPLLIWLHADLAPELVGIGITLILIDWAVEKRQKAALEAQLKAQLIRLMSSRHNEVADTAVRELAHHGWLGNGSLNGADLQEANLRDANLESAVLSQANLMHAKLSKANMVDVHLDSATLIDAKLDQASLQRADLSKAILLRANLNSALAGSINLSGACLAYATLDECNLRDAKLIGANLQETVFTRANLRRADLTGVSNWTIRQLEQGADLSLTVMPNGVRLGHILLNSSASQRSPTFEEWKTQYLASHGGTETDLRDVP